MKNLKNLVAAGLTIAGVATSPAQQVLKRITDNSTSTIVELFVLRNGTSPSNVVGESGFNTSSSSSSGTVLFYNPTGTTTYDPLGTINGSFPTIPNEPIGNGNFQTSQATQSTRTNFTSTTNSADILDISVIRTDNRADALEDANINTDLLKSKFVLPKTLNNGSPIPTGTRALLRSRTGRDLATGGSMPSSQRLGFQFNNNTRESRTNDRLGVPFNTMAETTLGTEDFEIVGKPTMKAYPNPTTDNITLDNGDNIDNNFDFEVYDITGKKVGGGQGKEGQPINIEDLTSGNYIISTQDEEGKKETNKIIKK